MAQGMLSYFVATPFSLFVKHSMHYKLDREQSHPLVILSEKSVLMDVRYCWLIIFTIPTSFSGFCLLC